MKMREYKKSVNWGYHYIANIGRCDVETMRSKEHIKEFLRDLLNKTDMHAMGEPVFKYIRKTKETVEKAIDGYSVVQIIVTSSVTMHFVESTKMIFFDFFSCKPFNRKVVKQLLRTYFKYSRIEDAYMTRATLL